MCLEELIMIVTNMGLPELDYFNINNVNLAFNFSMMT